jgi:hypothetical protein
MPNGGDMARSSMGRYVLGILAVVAIQIAFSIYMSYNKPNEPTLTATNVNADNGKTGLAKRRVPAKSKLPFAGEKGIEIETAKPANAANADETVRVEARRPAFAFAPQAVVRAARSTDAAAPRRTVFRNRTQADRASVERQYFGRMVVERTFGPAKMRPNRSTAIVNRQTFGRMVVERTSGV